MHVLQRSISILLAAFFFIFAITFVVEEKENYGYEQWEEIQVNRFLQHTQKAETLYSKRQASEDSVLALLLHLTSFYSNSFG